MSLQAHALAICAAGGLAAALPPWMLVRLEPHDPVELAEKEGKVLVAVYVGDEQNAVTGRRWSVGATAVELVVQVILPARVKGVIAGVALDVDTHAGGTSILFAVVHESLRRLFTAPDPGTWGALLQAVYTTHPEPLTSMPGKAMRAGKPAVPMIDYSIPCAVIDPPPLGEAAPYPWPDIVAAMRADRNFTPREADFLAALIAGAPLSGWRADLALAGLSIAEGAALGLGAPLIEDAP